MDEEECDVLVAIAKSKTLKPIKTFLNPLQLKSAEKAFRDWDYDRNGYISYDEVRLVTLTKNLSNKRVNQANDVEVLSLFLANDEKFALTG